MHEFVLYGQIPYRRHRQTLSALAEVTGARLTSFQEQHFIYEPSPAIWKANTAGVGGTKKNQQNVAKQQRYLQDVFRSITTAASTEAQLDMSWKVLTNEEPEPGSPSMISRSYTISEVSDSSQFGDQSNYRLHGQHIRSGHYFVIGNVVVRIFQVLIASNPQAVSMNDTVPSIEQSKLLDLSGTYLIEASIKLEDRTNSKLSDQASKELLEVKKLLQGTIELNVPDRFSLDTRAR